MAFADQLSDTGEVLAGSEKPAAHPLGLSHPAYGSMIP